jgi:DNA-directed RNA polymerase specialized sigma24 family protein
MKDGVWGDAAGVLNDDDQELSLATRLARLWAVADRTAFYAVMVGEGVPHLRRIVSSGLNLQVSDAEDCVAEALEAFIERQDDLEVSDPYAYLARSAWNRGATLHRRRRHELVSSVEALSTPAVADASDALIRTSSPVPGTWAVVAVEETLSDVEADESWAVIVVEAALEKLTVKQRALVRYLSTLQFDFFRKDFDVQSQVAAASLGMKAAAFRKAKQRAYEALRAVIPVVVKELGVRPPARFVAAFEETRGSFMVDHPDEDES